MEQLESNLQSVLKSLIQGLPTICNNKETQCLNSRLKQARNNILNKTLALAESSTLNRRYDLIDLLQLDLQDFVASSNML